MWDTSSHRTEPFPDSGTREDRELPERFSQASFGRALMAFRLVMALLLRSSSCSSDMKEREETSRMVFSLRSSLIKFRKAERPSMEEREQPDSSSLVRLESPEMMLISVAERLIPLTYSSVSWVRGERKCRSDTPHSRSVRDFSPVRYRSSE